MNLTLGAALFGSHIPQDQAFAFLDAFYAAGGRNIDTAHVYASWLENGEGASERCIGDWMRERGSRDQMFIATKGAHPDLKTGEKRINPACIQADLNESLERMQTDSIDLYFLHRDDIDLSVLEIAQWVNKWIARGVIGEWGVSNWRTDRIAEAIAACREHGLKPPIANQIGFSLAITEPTAGQAADMHYLQPDTFAWHVQAQLAVYAYSSQAHGLFAKASNFDALADFKALHKYQTPANANLFATVQAIAADLAATPLQVALATLLHAPFPCFPIIGASRIEQLEESLGAASLKLSEEHVERLLAHWR